MGSQPRCWAADAHRPCACWQLENVRKAYNLVHYGSWTIDDKGEPLDVNKGKKAIVQRPGWATP